MTVETNPLAGLEIITNDADAGKDPGKTILYAFTRIMAAMDVDFDVALNVSLSLAVTIIAMFTEDHEQRREIREQLADAMGGAIKDSIVRLNRMETQ